MSAITTHVLDTGLGRPAAGVPVRLEKLCEEHGSHVLGGGTTDADGRLGELVPADQPLKAGTYRLTFDTAAYFRDQQREAFYPEVSVLFEIRDPGQHYHVPLLLSPYGYSTYRGS
ncbi:MAG: hydroxyisourate hydrolase [Gemmatimonadetes bacterium]|nr:hydroxyisourate hydrolase [Gemmatimonadota bacterium]